MTKVEFWLEDKVKEKVDEVLEEIGLPFEEAITVFLKTVAREKRIPFEIKAYSSKD